RGGRGRGRVCRGGGGVFRFGHDFCSWSNEVPRPETGTSSPAVNRGSRRGGAVEECTYYERTRTATGRHGFSLSRGPESSERSAGCDSGSRLSKAAHPSTTLMPMLRAVPSMIREAWATSRAFRSFSFFLAMSSTCFLVRVNVLYFPPF